MVFQKFTVEAQYMHSACLRAQSGSQSLRYPSEERLLVRRTRTLRTGSIDPDKTC